jgi:hypothetical protein
VNPCTATPSAADQVQQVQPLRRDGCPSLQPAFSAISPQSESATASLLGRPRLPYRNRWPLPDEVNNSLMESCRILVPLLLVKILQQEQSYEYFEFLGGLGDYIDYPLSDHIRGF